MSKIKSCDDLSPDNLLQLEIDETKLKELFPIFYEKLQKKKLDPKFIQEKVEGISDELTFVNELVEEENDEFDTSNLDYIYKKKDSIIINIENSNNQSITNYSIIDFHGTTCDDHSTFIIDDHYLLIHVSRAAKIAKKNFKKRQEKNKKIFDQIIKLMKSLNGNLNGDEKYLLGNCINFSIPTVDAEAFMLTTKDLISISNGSACTSSTYEPSHVIKAMNNSENILKGAVRISWCHLTDDKIPIEEIQERLQNII